VKIGAMASGGCATELAKVLDIGAADAVQSCVALLDETRDPGDGLARPAADVVTTATPLRPAHLAGARVAGPDGGADLLERSVDPALVDTWDRLRAAELLEKVQEET